MCYVMNMGRRGKPTPCPIAQDPLHCCLLVMPSREPPTRPAHRGRQRVEVASHDAGEHGLHALDVRELGLLRRQELQQGTMHIITSATVVLCLHGVVHSPAGPSWLERLSQVLHVTCYPATSAGHLQSYKTAPERSRSAARPSRRPGSRRPPPVHRAAASTEPVPAAQRGCVGRT